jgi:hypothetical protein
LIRSSPKSSRASELTLLRKTTCPSRVTVMTRYLDATLLEQTTDERVDLAEHFI